MRVSRTESLDHLHPEFILPLGRVILVIALASFWRAITPGRYSEDVQGNRRRSMVPQ